MLTACQRHAPTTEPPFETASGDTGDPPTVRVVSWNVQGLGSSASAGFESVRAVLARLDGDVVGLQEVDEKEASELTSLASELGYPHVQLARSTPYGPLRNAVLTRLPPATLRSWSAEELSGDAQAEDVTRQPVSTTIDTPWGRPLTVVVQHCKAGFDDIDEFRRNVDAWRTAQAASGSTLLMGDINEDPREGPEQPSSFGSVPPGAPPSYQPGDDLSELLGGPGMVNDPFALLADQGFRHVEAAQGDGRVETRDSGRWIDHILLDASLEVRAIEIYDTRDDGLTNLPMGGMPPGRDAVRSASDHLPVVADVTTR